MSESTPQQFEVVAIRYGTRLSTKSAMYLNYQVYGEPDEQIELSYYIWILRSAARVVVVDTGYSPEAGAARGRTSVLSVGEALERAGVDASTVPEVIITHAHDDHMGNLGLFPAATFVMAEAERDFWTGPYAQRSQFRGSVEAADIDALRSVDAGGRVRTFGDRLELTPGIDIIRVGGHTPGQVVVKVNTVEGVVLLCSDAVHFYDELALDRPFAFVADLVAMYDGFDLVRQLVDSGQVRHVIPGHDSRLLTQFTAATGDLKGIAVTIGGLPASEM